MILIERASASRGSPLLIAIPPMIASETAATAEGEAYLMSAIGPRPALRAFEIALAGPASPKKRTAKVEGFGAARGVRSTSRRTGRPLANAARA